MDVFTALEYVVLGCILGAVGQGMRVIVGIKKQLDEASASGKRWEDWFEMKQFLVSLVIAFTIGGIAGVLGAIELLGTGVTKESMIALITIGYAGTDFIEGFMKKKPQKNETLFISTIE
jgi:Mn2+/Fe2+ NRAMP family transporter